MHASFVSIHSINVLLRRIDHDNQRVERKTHGWEKWCIKRESGKAVAMLGERQGERKVWETVTGNITCHNVTM